MEYFELICTSYIKKDIGFKDSIWIISKYISYVMAQDEKLEKLHKTKDFKYYVFGGLLPIEHSRVYKQGNSYKFSIRSLDVYFIDALSQKLRENINNPHFQVIQTIKQKIKQFFITELYTATPTIATSSNGFFWTVEKDGDILKLQKQLHDNLEKKYKTFYSKELKAEQNFIQLLEVKNRVPQNIEISKNDKKVRLFGNKFRIIPNEDDISQKLAFVALGAGLGEKNSFGGGFCLSKRM